MPKRKFPEKAKAYTWTAYMLSHHPAEIYRLLKYGTPSDELIKLSRRRVFMRVDKNDIRAVTFPVSLNKSAGQKLLFKAASDLIEFKKKIPVGMFLAFQEAKSLIKCRRADMTANVLLVVEALYSRAAQEFKLEVLFSFDSINAWINAKYGKTLGYHTLRKALEFLEEKTFITVREWGQKNVRHKATKIYINLDSSWRKADLFEADEWILTNSPAMTAVYARESTTRQDVLVALFQNLFEKEEERISNGEPAWSPLTRLFPASDVKIDVQSEVLIEEIEFKEIWDDVYIDRLLGRVVQPMQEDVTTFG